VKGLNKLRPGHMLVVERGQVIEHHRWWHPTWRGRSTPKDVERAVRDAVSLQRDADVEVGALLSGGVDSSIVVGLASDGRKVRTYALGRDADDEELSRARAASERFSTRHHETTFSDAQLDRLDALIAQLGEPVALLPLTHADVLLEAVASDGLKVVLTGNGADELFCGYHGAPRLRVASLAMRVLEKAPRRGLERFARSGRPRALADLAALAAVPVARRKEALYREEIASRLGMLAPALRADAAMSEECPVFGPWAAAFDGRDFLDISQFLTLVVEDAHSITLSADLAGMHNSVEARAPFLDPVVVDTALRLPTREKLGSFRRPMGKRVLKERFRALIGDDTVVASKMGFGYAMQESDLIRGPFRGRIESRIRSGYVIDHHLCRAEVERILDEHMSGGHDHGKIILSLYALETWHQVVVAPAVPAP
jgi:asparagine synthase (glutamine-hydrolysing)